MSKKGENIYRRKDGRWEARCKKGVTAEGRILYLYCYGKTYREAKEKLELRKKQIYTGQQSRPSSPSRSLGAYCDEWLLFNQNKVKDTYDKQIKTTANYIKKTQQESAEEYKERLLTRSRRSSPK